MIWMKWQNGLNNRKTENENEKKKRKKELKRLISLMKQKRKKL